MNELQWMLSPRRHPEESQEQYHVRRKVCAKALVQHALGRPAMHSRDGREYQHANGPHYYWKRDPVTGAKVRGPMRDVGTLVRAPKE